MKEVLNFIRGKLDTTSLKFHYLRIGKAAPLLDDLRAESEDLNLTWDHEEADSFADYHFGSSYAEYDGALINLGINDENVAEIRREFWQNFIWETEDKPLLLAIVYPDTSTFGSLSRSQLIESLSLVRLTDRPFELFENNNKTISKIIDWIGSLASVVHRIEREEEE